MNTSWCFPVSLVMLFALIADAQGRQKGKPIASLGELSKVSRDARELYISVNNTSLLKAVAKRYPDLERLRIFHNGTLMLIDNLKILQKFHKLRSLELSGDPFLSDEKFRLLGSLLNLRSLKLSLP